MFWTLRTNPVYPVLKRNTQCVWLYTCVVCLTVCMFVLDLKRNACTSIAHTQSHVCLCHVSLGPEEPHNPTAFSNVVVLVWGPPKVPNGQVTGMYIIIHILCVHNLLL